MRATLPDGRTVEAITLQDATGSRVVVINYGATLQSVVLPDRNGKLADVIWVPAHSSPISRSPSISGRRRAGLRIDRHGRLQARRQGVPGAAQQQRHSFEPQLFPDTPDQPAFGSARLAPGEEYRNLIVYRFGTSP
jgi:galactose mutarotase-like enzyme